MPEITTRVASAADLPRLFALWEEQHDILAQLDPRLEKWSPPDDFGKLWLRRTIELKATSGDTLAAVVLVAEREGESIGFASALYDSDLETGARTGKIEHFVVDAHGGGGGVGTALLNAVRQWAAEQHVAVLTVDVPRHHAVQQAFWRAKGAVVVGTRPEQPIERMRIEGSP
jgi:GNAT superfamily N-acetyltransferase